MGWGKFEGVNYNNARATRLHYPVAATRSTYRLALDARPHRTRRSSVLKDFFIPQPNSHRAFGSALERAQSAHFDALHARAAQAQKSSATLRSLVYTCLQAWHWTTGRVSTCRRPSPPTMAPQCMAREPYLVFEGTKLLELRDFEFGAACRVSPAGLDERCSRSLARLPSIKQKAQSPSSEWTHSFGHSQRVTL